MDEIYTVSILISIFVFILSTHITPGPTNIILLSSIFSFGYKKSIPFMLGCIISYPLLMFLAGLGVASFLIQFPKLMFILKIFGVAYLAFMAWNIAKANTSFEDNPKEEKQKPFRFLDAFIYSIFNIKAWIIYISAISLFVKVSENNLYQISIIVFITFLSMIITVYVWSFGAIILKRFIKNKRIIKALNILMAFLLLVSILPLIL